MSLVGNVLQDTINSCRKMSNIGANMTIPTCDNFCQFTIIVCNNKCQAIQLP